MSPKGTLLLKRKDVAQLLTVEECISAVEQAFKLYGEGKTSSPGIISIPAQDGGFHIKAGMLTLGRKYFAAKTNGNFFFNLERFGMPRIQGIIVLCDGENGYPLALMDSIEITILRTGAATAVAAKYLARADSMVATICGCGNQGRISLKALLCVHPIRKAYAYDINDRQAQQFASDLSSELGIEVAAVRDLARAVKHSDICVTCTPSRKQILDREDVSRGTFVAAVGADSPEKQELDPALMGSSKVVVDIIEQCAMMGDLHHAMAKGLLTKADVYAELGEVVAGRKPGRTAGLEIIIFDSTGMALQDVAAAAAVYEKAVKAGKGVLMDLAE